MLSVENIFLWVLGPAHPTLSALFILMVLDLLTRVLVHFIRPKSRAEKASRTLLKKLLLWMLLTAAHQIDQVLGQDQSLRNAVTYILLGNELFSIVEQMARAGVPIPEPLRRTIQALRAGEGEAKEKTRA
ncbi:phage holin family protein [Deinococcus cellulosilyticus]|uniref:Holin n=1 Tax=Deinococcus cellulosilyticus (strain DSM 18568 / NBRC 106333 / KACC 11606 / 5516J-15) TaxID=1223518 RepID=A0A511N2H1_DEIC1|nr:phage holin family protein [Deinococcus cellulosilyticus]GEM46616.1 hypothetical protein DC3_22510 [Deinococcus cellulosilyticus NBRC 106333 = KACC 11606]